MQLKFALVTLASVLIAFVGAAPATNITLPQPEAAQVDGHVYICTDANWVGTCTNYGFTKGVCSNFPSPFDDSISSVGPDAGWTCILYINTNCNSNHGTYNVEAPGFTSLGYGNDQFSSVQCL